MYCVLWRLFAGSDAMETASAVRWSPGTVPLAAGGCAAGGASGSHAVCYKDKEYGYVIMHTYKNPVVNPCADTYCGREAREDGGAAERRTCRNAMIIVCTTLMHIVLCRCRMRRIVA